MTVADVSSLGPPFGAQAATLIDAAAVGQERAHKLCAVVDVDELVDVVDADVCVGPASAEADDQSVVADVAVRADLAHDRVLGVGGLVGLGERELAERRGRQVALGGGEVADPLVRPLLVVGR